MSHGISTSASKKPAPGTRVPGQVHDVGGAARSYPWSSSASNDFTGGRPK
ncbi:hypothetical protein SBD_2395 [Streptomyces bottropensis ATCC 25435]|uniref:Uncharacterized protein n=1 Tax=Streptomyces bottropensis ATCC 25435 TaxID=1054862 RepID=M3EFS2_9ACTN|nr:hypothetical protein SBD_2395 [Streptomyces bottropensis ATCC 25435]